MRELRRLVQENVLHDHAFQALQRMGHVLRIRIRLGDVFALDVQTLETAVDRRIEHVRNAQARLVVQLHAPHFFELRARLVVGNMAISGQFMRERTHVAGTLHVVLSAQRIHAHAFAADVAGGHGKVGNAHDHGRTLAVLGDAQPVVNRPVAARRVQARGAADLIGRHAGGLFHLLRRIARLGNECLPLGEFLHVAARGDEIVFHQPLGHDHVGERIDQRDIGARAQLQVIRSLDVRRAHHVDGARVGDDQLRAFAQPALHARSEHRMAVGRIGADDHHHIRLHYGIEILGAGGFAERGLQSVAGRRVAHARAGIDVVVAECSAHHFLHQVGFFIGATRGRDPADRAAAILGLDALELRSSVIDRLVPGHFAPGIADLAADHRLLDAVRVRGITERKAALDAGMTAIGLAFLVRHHAHDFRTLHLCAEGTTHAAVGAGGNDSVIRLSLFDDGFFHQGRGRAGLHAGAAGNAFRFHERLVFTRRDHGSETPAVDGQRKGALHFLAGAHAARADDALARIETEVGIGVVLLGFQVVLAFIAVAHFAQADHARHVLQFAVAVRGTGQAVERMVGDVQLHHAAPQIRQLRCLRAHLHARRHRGGTGSGIALAAFDLDQAQAAGTECFEAVGGAQLGHLDARVHGRTHDRRALGH